MTRHCWLICALLSSAGFAHAAGQESSPPMSRAEELLGRIELKDPELSRRSLIELERMGQAAAEALLGGWRSLPAPYDLQALALLLRLDTEQALSGLESAARSNRFTHRRAAAAAAGELYDARPERVTGLLCRLINDADQVTADEAAGALRVQAPTKAWNPLLSAMARLILQDPEQGRIQVYVRALGSVLAAHPSEQRVTELLERCAGEEGPAQLRWLSVLTTSQAPATFATLRELLGACYATGDGLAPLIERGLSSTAALRALLLEGLPRDEEAFPLFLQGLRDPEAQVRVQALRMVRGLAQAEPRRTQAVQVVVQLLVDPSHDLRREAHRWLQQVTRQRLPLSHSEWQRWAGEHAAEVELSSALERWAASRGFASLKELLERHGSADREQFLRDQGYETWDRFLRDQEVE